MQSVVTEGESPVTKPSCGKRGCREEDGIGNWDTGRGGSGRNRGRGDDFDEGWGRGRVGGSGGDIDERKTGGEDEMGDVHYGKAEASGDRVGIRCARGAQVRPQCSGVQESVGKPEQMHLESPDTGRTPGSSLEQQQR